MLSHIPCRVFIISQDNQSHFYVSLQQWRQLNLSPAFVQFANKVDPLCVSMPLLLHNWREVTELWQAAIVTAEDEALRALLEYLSLFMSLMGSYVLAAYFRNWHTTFERPSFPYMQVSWKHFSTSFHALLLHLHSQHYWPHCRRYSGIFLSLVYI